MCLAIPHRIISFIGSNRAIALAGAVETEIRTDLVPDAAVDDVVIVHAGFAIEKLRQEDGAELEKIWKEVTELAGYPE
jgi:hydrogenase expression/formation protein HypC